MKNKIVAVSSIFLLSGITLSPTSFAEEINDMSEEPSTQTTYDPGMSPNEQAGWAVLDENGNTTNIIVCTPEVCGGGTFDGKKVVLQTLQDKETGNVAGYPDAKYDDVSGSWTIDSHSLNSIIQEGEPEIYEVPLTYPDSDSLKCIQNCPVEEIEAVTTTPLDAQSMQSLESSDPEDYSVITTKSNFVVKNNGPKNVNKTIYIKTKRNISSVTVIAKKWTYFKNPLTKSWKIKVNKKDRLATFAIPQQYLDWKIIIKNKRSNVKKVFVKNL